MRDKKKKSGGDLPQDILDLRLKKVKVTCSVETWEKLDQGEKDATLAFLESKEQEVKNSKNIKGCTVRITSEKLLDISDDAIDELNADVATNKASMEQGDAPKEDTTGMKGKTIGVNVGEPKTIVVPIKTVTQEPVLAPQEVDAVLKGDGSTFDSAEYETADMQQSGVLEILEEASAKIAEILAQDPDAKITVTALGCESQVPNPRPKFKDLGSLATARAQNAIALAQSHLASFAGATISYGAEIMPPPQDPKWDRKLGAHNDCYTAYQWVQLKIHAEMQVETGETKDVEKESEIEETSYDAERVVIGVRNETKGKGNSFDKKFKKTYKKGPKKTGTSTKKWKKVEYKTTPCHFKS